eukprot:CAMPEP_0202446394 /NCGR_PEP_ID=MMETSP1360-20130828/4890_1 /ASSEMBLY_ACC=CAM_ASM_000848 /TAXON_ID=515479 /ORGANISM="Licmophora paradoxa, Strain CCMP2313" /LENGTH=560 /DNA_ID=CAMNT_0049062853 /DNA_START=124 /DNA_END=1806 /DNA_ORIENTATION=+
MMNDAETNHVDAEQDDNNSNSSSNRRSSSNNNNISSTQEMKNSQISLFQEAPLVAFLVSCAGTLSRKLRNIRWSCARPFQTTIIPCLFSGITVTQILFFLLLLVWIFQSAHHVFIKPSIDSTGELTSYAIYLTFLTANKSNSIFAIFLGIPYDRLVYLHRMTSLAAVLLGFFHVYVVLTWDGDESDPILDQLFQNNTNITGTIVFLSILFLVGSSLFRFILRKYCYQIWFSFHIVLALTAALSLILHEGSIILIVIVAWTLVDVLFRFTLGRHKLKMMVSVVDTGSQNPMVVLRSPNIISHSAGQFLRVTIPSVSLFESHTFSISSSPHDQEMTMHISCSGDWGSKLVTLVQKRQDEDGNDIELDVYVDGPYGSLTLNADKYDSFLFVSGGIGVTPCLSIARQLIWEAKNQDRNIRYFNFVWAVRDLSLVTALSKEMGSLPVKGVSFIDEVGKTQNERSKKTETSLQDRSSSIFVTRASDNDLEAVSNELNSSCHLGRPNLENILKETAESLKKGNVAIIACGSPSLIKDLEIASRNCSSQIWNGTGGVFFDLHTESFAL